MEVKLVVKSSLMDFINSLRGDGRARLVYKISLVGDVTLIAQALMLLAGVL